MGPRRLSGMKYVVARAIQAEIVVLGVVGALCLVMGWRSTSEFTGALWVAGVVILAGGAATLLVGPNPRRHLEDQYVLAAMHALSDEERIRQDKAEMQHGRRLLAQGLLLGGLTIGIAAVIDLVAG
jgi:hypothetical protein